jgi:hypothetical protein
MMARLLGTSSAPPIPCKERAAINHGASGASPQPTEAVVNTTVPSIKMRRRPKRSPAAPPTRINALSVSM